MPREEIVNQISSLFSGRQVTYDDLFKIEKTGEQPTYDELFGQPAEPLQPTTEEVRPIESRESIVNKLLKNIDYAFVPETAKQATTEVPEFQTDLEEIAIRQPELYKRYSQLRKENLSHEAAMNVSQYESRPEGRIAETFGEKVVGRFQAGTASSMIDANLMYESAIGARNYDEARKIKDEFDRRRQLNPMEGESFAQEAILSASEIGGPMAEGIRQGHLYGTAAVVAALLAGQSGVQAFTPEEIITAPTAYALGQTVGQAIYWYKMGTGMMYDQLRKQGVDHSIASPLAQISGIPYALIERLQVGKIANPILRRILGREAPQLVASTIPRMMVKMLALLGKNVVTETGEEVVQKGLEIATNEVGKEINNRLKGTDLPPTTINDVVDEMKQEAKAAGPGLAILLLPGHASKTLTSVSGVNKFNKEVEKIGGGLGLDKKESKEVAKQTIIDVSKGEDIQTSISRNLQIKVSEKLTREIEEKEEVPTEPEKIEISNFEQYKEAELERLTDEAEKKKLEENPKQYIDEQISTLEELIEAEPELGKQYQTELDQLKEFSQEIEDASAIRSDKEKVAEPGVQPKESKDISSEDIQQPEPEQPSVPRVRQEEKEIVSPEVEGVPTEVEKKPLERDFVGELQKATTIEDVNKTLSEFRKVDDSGEYEISGKYRNAIIKETEVAKERVREQPVTEVEQPEAIKEEKPVVEPEETPTVKPEAKEPEQTKAEEIPQRIVEIEPGKDISYEKMGEMNYDEIVGNKYEEYKKELKKDEDRLDSGIKFTKAKIAKTKDKNEKTKLKKQLKNLKDQKQEKWELRNKRRNELEEPLRDWFTGYAEENNFDPNEVIYSPDVGTNQPRIDYFVDTASELTDRSLNDIAKETQALEKESEKIIKKLGVETTKDRYLGKNEDGEDVYLDKNGVRYILTGEKKNIKSSEPVSVSPTGEYSPRATPPRQFRTTEELAKESEPKKEIKKPSPKEAIAIEAERLTESEIEEIHQDLKRLADADYDRATTRNDVGFNKMDTEIGNDLASKDKLTPKQAALGKKILRKYAKQLGKTKEDFVPKDIEAPIVKRKKPEADFVTSTINEEMNGVELTFSEKPDEKIRTELKKNGFKWSMKKKIWYATKNANTLTFAEELKNRLNVVEEKKPYSEEYGAKNKLVTRERAKELEEKLRQKLNQLNAGVDPEMFTIGTELAVFHIEAGVRKFTDYARTMVEQFGEKIVPFLKSFYLGAKNYPGVDYPGMNSEAEIEQLEREGFLNDMELYAETYKDKDSLNITKEELDGLQTNSDIPAIGNEKQLESEGVETTRTQTDNRERVSTGAGERIDGATASTEREETTISEATSINESSRRNSEKRYGGRDIPTVPRRNYRRGDFDETSGLKAKARATIEAIKTWKNIDKEGRQATPEEQETLSQFAGAGGLLYLFPDQNGKIKEGWEDVVNELQEILTNQEYDSLKSTLPNAHYTSPLVVNKVFNILEKFGFDGKGKIFEPGMGVGNFFSLMPEEWNEAELHGVEMDIVSGSIARLLYPNANITISPFQNMEIPNNTYDVIVGNVPFSKKIIPFDPVHNKEKFSLHDYFMNKGMNILRPGGLMAVITSRYTMDKVDATLRKKLRESGDLVFAVRLPKTAFQKTANTEVVTDILVFRKRMEGEVELSRQWIETAKEKYEDSDGELQEVNINKAFIDHDERIMGRISLTGTMYAKNEMTVTLEGSLEEKLNNYINEYMETVPEYEKYIPVSPTEREFVEQKFENAEFDNWEDVKIGAFTISKDGRLFIKQEGNLPVEVKIKKKGSKLGVNQQDYDRIIGFVRVRDAWQKVLTTQANLEPTAIKEQARRELNRVYDSYVKEFGYFNHTTKTEYTRAKDGKVIVTRRMKNMKPCMADPDVYGVSSLEDYDEDTGESKKNQIFTEDVIGIERPAQIETPSDALLASLNEMGRVDFDYMSEQLGIDEDKIIEELKGQIYLNPANNTYEIREKYLSGNVKRKLAEAKEAYEKDKSYADNVKALEEVQPEDVPPTQIAANLGQPWIPTEDVESFVTSIDENAEATITYTPREAKYHVSIIGMDETVSNNTWGTSKRSFAKLLETALNKGMPKILVKTTDENGNEKTVVDQEATALAQEKMSRIKERFSEWLWEDDERQVRLARLYNDTYNTNVVPKYDGSFLTFKGMKAKGGWFKGLYPHQKNAVWRQLQEGNTLLSHVVGSGKTITMVAAGMEMKRLGMINKPMYVVPNHMLRQFSNEFLELYPTAKLMVADEINFKTSKRKLFVNKIASQDIDAVIITHSGFGKIPISARTEERYVREEIEAYETLITEAKRDRDTNATKDLEARKLNLQERLRKLSASMNRDTGIEFEKTGIDYIFIDEAHEFKNLETRTKMAALNIKNLPTQGAAKTWDLFVKSRYLSERNPKRFMTFATGTPVSNSMVELYNLMRYLQPGKLQELGMEHFDAWASSFCDVVSQIEIDPTGSGFRMDSRFAKFVNLPELMQAFGEVNDFVSNADLIRDGIINLPPIKGGKAKLIQIEPDETQKNAVQWLKYRLNNLTKPIRGADNALSIVNDGRLIAIDPRSRFKGIKQPPKGKVATVTNEIYRIWKETKDKRYTQLVFSDLSTPSKTKYSVYNDIRSALIRKGVPKDDIAFMHDYPGAVQKERLFSDMRAGNKRILFGSTKKMGMGTNVQKNLYAVHHIDAPWRPADVEQRDGRIYRQGNLCPEIEIIRYVTKGTFDAYMWQTLEVKQGFIEQLLKGSAEIREMEDVNLQDALFDPAQAKALAAANPYMFEKVKTDVEIKKLGALKKAMKDEEYTRNRKLKSEKDFVARSQERIKVLDEAIKKVVDTTGDKFKIKLGEKVLTDRKKAEEYLLKTIQPYIEKHKKGEIGNLSSMKVGELAGTDLRVQVQNYKDKFYIASLTLGSADNSPFKMLEYNYKSSVDLYITKMGKLSGESPTSLHDAMLSLEHISRSLPKRKEYIEKQIENSEKLIKSLSQESARFQQEDKLKQLKERSLELETLIRQSGAQQGEEEFPNFEDIISKYTGRITSNIIEYIGKLAAEKGGISQALEDRIRQVEQEEEDIEEQRKHGKITGKELTVGSLAEWNAQAILMLDKAVPGIKVYYDIPKTKFNEALAQIGAIGDPLGFFSPKNNVIFINPTKANKDTIFHEYAHPVVGWIKKSNPALYQEGIELLKDSPYKTTEEGLVQAIGEKGAQIQDGYKKNRFVAWIKKVWIKTKIRFKRLFNIDLTLNEFTEMISYAMRGGKPIVPKDVSKRLVKPQFQYAGERAKKADFGNLEQAKVLENEGKQREYIRGATGWFKGPDNLWRFEIDDNDMKFKHRKGTFPGEGYQPNYWNEETGRLEQRFSGNLGGIIEHTELFENYSELYDLPIYLNIHPEYGVNGSIVTDVFNLANSYISLEAPNENKAREALAHEIQHWIQYYEGFAKGSNLVLNVESVQLYRDMETNLEILRNRINDTLRTLKRTDLSESEKRNFTNEIEDDRNYYNEIYDELKSIKQKAYERYLKSAGEFEARDVSSRIDMPKDLKFLSMPYSSEKLDFKDLIVDMKGGNRAMLMQSMEDPFITEMREKYHAGVYEDVTDFLESLKKEGLHFTDVARAKKYQNEIEAEKIEPEEEAPFDLPVETWYQHLQRLWQDKYNRSGQVIREARKTEDISDELDFRLGQELFIGRASDQIERFQKKLTNNKNGFLERLTDNNIAWQDLSLFMYARHAPERNKTIRERDPENNAGSGMTDREARDIMLEFEEKGMTSELTRFADEFYEIVTKPTVDVLYEGGLLKESEYEAYTSGEWKYYVPLKGIERSKTFRMRGKGYSVEYKGIIKAKGRHSLAQNNPFIQAIMDHEDAIIRAEKNKVGQQFLDFVLKHKSPMWKAEGRKKVPNYNKYGEIEYFRNAKQRLGENEFAVWVDGKQKVITIYDEPLLNGLKNIGVEKGWKFLNKINHWLRLTNTMLNPEFIISNFERDLQTALINLEAFQIKKIKRNVVKDVPKAMNGIWKGIRDKEGNEWTGLFDEYKAEGGKTGWFDYKTLDEKTEDFEKKITNYKKSGNIKKALELTRDFVFDINDTVENAVRLSAYKHAKDAGMTKKQAANLAKNLTLNFNKKGEKGGFMNSLYLFANAGVQGGARLLVALKSNRVKRIGVGLILWSILWDTINRLIGGDDYEKIDDYIKDTNHIFMIPGTDKHFRIRLPYGYNVFNVIGLAISDTFHGGDPLRQGGRILSNIVDAFNPLGRAGSLGQLISPTAFDLPLQLFENKNFFGGPIRKEQPAYAPKTPESERYFRSVNPYTQQLTTWLNDVTGGSSRERGWLDINPENIDHVLDFAGGGTGRFLIRSINVPWTLISEGNFPPPEKIPFVRQVYGERSEWMDFKKVNRYIKEAGRTRFSRKQVTDFMTSLNTLYEQKKITKENYKRKKAVFFNAQHRLKRKRVKK